ncbi:hypothetical protein D3C84_1103240 [compost metagenome]
MLYAIGNGCVSAIQHSGKEVVHQLNQLGRPLFLLQRRTICVRWDCDETDIATGRFCDLIDSIGKRQRPRPGQFIKLA